MIAVFGVPPKVSTPIAASLPQNLKDPGCILANGIEGIWRGQGEVKTLAQCQPIKLRICSSFLGNRTGLTHNTQMSKKVAEEMRWLYPPKRFASAKGNSIIETKVVRFVNLHRIIRITLVIALAILRSCCLLWSKFQGAFYAKTRGSLMDLLYLLSPPIRFFIVTTIDLLRNHESTLTSIHHPPSRAPLPGWYHGIFLRFTAGYTAVYTGLCIDQLASH